MAVSAEQQASDRAFVLDEFKTLYGRQPTAFELQHVVDALENGTYTRERWVAESQPGGDANATVIRVYTEIVGKPPTDPAGVQYYADRLRNGQITQAQMRQEMADATARNRAAQGITTPTGTGVSDDQQNARDIINDQLHQYGLDSLSDWAWQEILAGNSAAKVMQDLRQRPEYKARFPAMDSRRALGLPPISEQQYIESEGTFRDIMRSNGMPPGFWDQPSDYTALIANDISPTELQQRVQDGWAKVTNAPPEVRQVFKDWFGPDGDTALAAYFIDPSKAESVLMKAVETARMGGYANLFGMNVTQTRANQIFDFGKTADQAIQAYGALGNLSPVFDETVSETADLTKEQQGLNAELGLDATSQAAINQRLRQRSNATAGGGGALLGQQGLGAGTAE